MSITRQNLSVIIVSYKSGHVIENCINSINSEIEIVVVDNSKDHQLPFDLNQNQIHSSFFVLKLSTQLS